MRWTRWLWLALIGLQIAWFGLLHPPEMIEPWLVLAIVLVPLLVPLPWILKLRPQALVLGGTLLLLHFSIAVSEAWTDPDVRAIALGQIALIVLFYLALPGFGRRRGTTRN